MKYIISGRTGCGKTALIDYLKTNYNWVFAKSSTTRPKRTETENQYHFITPEEAANIPENEKMLKTIIGTHEYFLAKNEIETKNAFLLTPDGIETLIKESPDECFCIIYLKADKKYSKEHVIQRGVPEIEIKNFEKRYNDEDAVFSKFEQDIEDQKIDSEHVLVIECYNNFNIEFIKNTANTLNISIQFFSNIKQIIMDLIHTGVINSNDSENPTIILSNKEKSISKEELALYLYRYFLINKEPSILESILTRWITLPNINIHQQKIPNLTPNQKEIITNILNTPYFTNIINKHSSTKISDLAEEINTWLNGQYEFQQNIEQITKQFISEYLIHNLQK